MIDCVHEGEKTPITIKFRGSEKRLNACNDCENVLRSSVNVCEVIP